MQDTAEDRYRKHQKYYNLFAGIVFIFATTLFAYLGIIIDWLPTTFLILGITVCLRQLVIGNHLDVVISLILFGLAFFISFLDLFAKIFLPSLFVLGGIYYVIRQFFSFQSPKEKSPSVEQVNAIPMEEPLPAPQPSKPSTPALTHSSNKDTRKNV